MTRSKNGLESVGRKYRRARHSAETMRTKLLATTTDPNERQVIISRFEAEVSRIAKEYQSATKSQNQPTNRPTLRY